jgi:hypothetical protein
MCRVEYPIAVPTSSTAGSSARQSTASIRPVSQWTIGTESRSATASISAITPERSGRSAWR